MYWDGAAEGKKGPQLQNKLYLKEMNKMSLVQKAVLHLSHPSHFWLQ